MLRQERQQPREEGMLQRVLRETQSFARAEDETRCLPGAVRQGRLYEGEHGEVHEIREGRSLQGTIYNVEGGAKQARRKNSELSYLWFGKEGGGDKSSPPFSLLSHAVAAARCRRNGWGGHPTERGGYNSAISRESEAVHFHNLTVTNQSSLSLHLARNPRATSRTHAEDDQVTINFLAR